MYSKQAVGRTVSIALGSAVLAALTGATTSAGNAIGGGSPFGDGPFRRIATFPVFLNTDVDLETVSEIVTASTDGNTLIYTDSATESIGFVDIVDPAHPLPAGTVAVGGEPTSVAVRGGHALACVNTSVDFVDTSGNLEVIDIATREIVRTIALGGQPDAIAISPDGQYAAIAIENERDEDLGEGEPPQAPPGYLVIVDLFGDVQDWTIRRVGLVGIPLLFPEDPEPEFVDINELNYAVVTLQENNHIVFVHLPTGSVVADFSAGSVDLDDIDIDENDLVQQDASLRAIPREPDAVAWTSPFTFATADEGDLFGGSRGFTTWTFLGDTLFQAESTVEHHVARLGHYPESRSENKGNEPEAVEFGRYGAGRFLFVGSERASLVLVYQLFLGPIFGNSFPVFRQALPTGVGPEGLAAIPQRDLFIVASENDAREDKYRSTISIYALTGESTYPTILSEDREGTEVPIPWAALSGLVDASEGGSSATLAVHDSFYRESRVFTLDTSGVPALLTTELALVDGLDVLQDAFAGLKAQLEDVDDFDPSDAVNDNGTVNLDLEGIAVDSEGYLWVASEGAGNLVDGVSDPDDRPFESPNALVRVAPDGTIVDVVFLPLSLTRNQLRFGFEGVAVADGALYVAFQRAWQAAGDAPEQARIGRYDLATGTWGFAYYPLDAVTSPAGGWVGLSELTYLGGDRFAVIERDNQAGTDAAIKRVYSFSVEGVAFLDEAAAGAFNLLSKELELDLVAAETYAPTGGPIPEKLEGLALLADGTVLIVNDNDGVDDNSGETQLLRLPNLFE